MKRDRLEKVKELIEKYNIETQEELVSRLNAEGFMVTQATVSRDIRQLNLTKIPMGKGQQKYAVIQNLEGLLSDKYGRVLKEGFVSADTAQNILVIKTVSGMAMAVAAAVDSMKFQEIVGSIAGDDTIMIAVRTIEDAKELEEKIQDLIKV